MRKVNEEFLDLEVSTQESSRPLAELHVVGRRESIIDGFGLMAIGHTTSYVVIKGEEVLSDLTRSTECGGCSLPERVSAS
jgi:hypothetical protein